MLDDVDKGKTAEKKGNFYGSLTKAYERFLKIRGTPREIALGVAWGLLVGMTIPMGIQTPIAVFFAALFKWNKISSAAGVWISNPVTAPIIYPINYIIGANILGINATRSFSIEPNFSIIYEIFLKAPEMIAALTLGGVILGLPIALLGYYIAHGAIAKYQKDIKEKLARKKTAILQKRKEHKEKKAGKRPQSEPMD